MNICMIVHNNGTRDGRVMREAHSLRAAGHGVTVIGVPESNVNAATEVLSDGVNVQRVQWQERARQRLRRSALLRGPLFLALFGGLAYLLFRAAAWLAGPGGPVVAAWDIASTNGARPILGIVIAAFATTALAGITAAATAAMFRLWQSRARESDRVRRAVVAGEPCPASGFPAIRSRVPDWLPDWFLEIAVEPLDWLGAKTGRFSMYRYRSEALAAAAIRLRPDIVHCHDCVALPTGWLVKKALGIPLIYDAHEIYEAVAARRFGATDYFARVHRKHLPHIDGFIAVNDSAATYYANAYPAAPRAVVIRNATVHTPNAAYDGRLHRAAGLPLGEKILLYQGGYTAHRGLQTLVRSAALLSAGWSLVMMGWGPLAGDLKRIAAELAPSRKAHFIPGVPAAELLEWTQGATAGIVPYEDKMLNHWIATPNKLWEYPGAGVPLIVQPFPEMRRIVETYHCGWVLPRKFSAAAIANLVNSLTEDMIESARAGCRAFVANDNWSTYEKRLLDLYEKIGGQAGGTYASDKLAPAQATV